MEGYSATPLWKKLGLQQESKLLLIGAPAAYFDWLGADFTPTVVKSGKQANMVHLFAPHRKDIDRHFPVLIEQLPADGIIWISWYKKSAGIATDVTEDVIREIVLPTGWVDVKVCAVSEEWSGLKIVKRKMNR